MTWAEACNDKRLQNLPYKIELNRQGKLVLSPTGNKHAMLQSRLLTQMHGLLPAERVITECAVDTTEGTYVADIASLSVERFNKVIDEASCSIAPELCVEVWSPSNSPEEIEMKRRLYLAKGAEEFWYCDAAGQMTHFDKSGALAQSKLCPQFPKQIA